MKKGFSLVELSIVLIIIGLLIAAVTGGNKLIENSKLQKVVRELQGLQIAFLGFKLTYDALPGDYKDASDLWGNDCENGATSTTCNGDGDGKIELVPHESFRATYHLLKADFINVNLTNKAANYDTLVPGTDIPTSSWPATGISMRTVGTGNRTALFLGAASTLGASPALWNDKEVFTPTQAFLIDKKMDDGKPEQGFFHGYMQRNTVLGSVAYETDAANDTTGCVASTGIPSFPDAAYNNSISVVACGGAYIIE